ncbi:hypothetical protein ACKZDW_14615 [Ralstonia syzygii subsp. celebesensis]
MGNAIHRPHISGTAEGFAQWFTSHAISLDDERSMLVANPDHYVLRGIQPNGQEAVEVTGGAIEASHFSGEGERFQYRSAPRRC